MQAKSLVIALFLLGEQYLISPISLFQGECDAIIQGGGALKGRLGSLSGLRRRDRRLEKGVEVVLASWSHWRLLRQSLIVTALQG